MAFQKTMDDCRAKLRRFCPRPHQNYRKMLTVSLNDSTGSKTSHTLPSGKFVRPKRERRLRDNIIVNPPPARSEIDFAKTLFAEELRHYP